PLTDFGGKTSIFSHPVYLFLREFSLQDFRGGSLSWLSEFIIKNANHKFVQVWGNGASFDCVILRNSYSLTGQPVPWQWWNDRDVRTIVELGKVIGFDPKRDMPFKGTRHNALDDAIHQAKYVSAIWKKLAK
ncbi:3'-5' exonuclease, partial [Escherichia coli]|uniref:3'-5' exonuclease n=1 Tax=Escherichia coli TaxID=562 RepID=UPI001F3F99A9